MASKQVAVLVRRTPLNSVKAAEALRHGVGLTLSANKVTLLLADAAAWLSVPLSPAIIGGGEIKKAIDTLLLMNGEVKVEAESLARFGIEPGRLLPGIQVVSSQEVVADMADAEATIVF